MCVCVCAFVRVWCVCFIDIKNKSHLHIALSLDRLLRLWGEMKTGIISRALSKHVNTSQLVWVPFRINCLIWGTQKTAEDNYNTEQISNFKTSNIKQNDWLRHRSKYWTLIHQKTNGCKSNIVFMMKYGRIIWGGRKGFYSWTGGLRSNIYQLYLVCIWTNRFLQGFFYLQPFIF